MSYLSRVKSIAIPSEIPLVRLNIDTVGQFAYTGIFTEWFGVQLFGRTADHTLKFGHDVLFLKKIHENV